MSCRHENVPVCSAYVVSTTNYLNNGWLLFNVVFSINSYIT